MREKGLTKADSFCLKGIAIIMLLFYHLYREDYLFQKFNTSFYPFSEDIVTSIVVMFKMCVSIFAFISGYGLLTSFKEKTINRKEVLKWNIERIIKTMSGFWIIYIVVFITTTIIDFYPYEVYFSEATTAAPLYIVLDFLGLSNLFGTPSMLFAWWYMSAAIVFIILVPVIYLLARKTGYLPIAFIIIMLPRVLNIGYPGGSSLYTFILPMIFGMIFADYDIFKKITNILANKKINYIIMFALLSLVIVYYYLFFNNVSKETQWELVFGIFPVFIICFCRFFVIRIPGINKVLMFLGKYSMNIYLIHNFYRHIYLKKFLFSFKNFLLIFLVLMFISLVTALLIELFKKLIKYNSIISKISKKLIAKIDNL